MMWVQSIRETFSIAYTFGNDIVESADNTVCLSHGLDPHRDIPSLKPCSVSTVVEKFISRYYMDSKILEDSVQQEWNGRGSQLAKLEDQDVR